MRTVIISVRDPDEEERSFVDSMESGCPSGPARISFVSPELLWKTLTAKRWEILRTMCGAGRLSIREVARRVGRDIKAVHGDITALLKAGVIDRSSHGVIFPFDTIKVEFEVRAA